MTFSTDGQLTVAKFADPFTREGLVVDLLNDLPTKMQHSHATGQGLISNGEIGVDLIHLRAGQGFVPHHHPGDHILVVLAGIATITFNGKIYRTSAGHVYGIEGHVPHAVGAITNTMIMAVGSPHRPVDSTDRMVPVEYESILVDGDLHCTICALDAVLPTQLHDVGCVHCPCYTCVGGNEPHL